MATAREVEARPRRYAIVGNHELDGGIGFAAGLSTWTPGGFKWFNDYGYRFTDRVWLNLQLNVATGGSGYGRCYYDARGRWVSCDGRGFGGTALELVGGVKLKWRPGAVPIQVHCKLGAAVDFIWFNGDFAGAAVAFRGGPGMRYFFHPTFGVGVELLTTFGPAFIRDWGVQFYGAIDMNFGIEWHFG